MSFLSVPLTIGALFDKGRKIGDINVNVVVNESTNDTLTITKQPVQQGASITDHAYKEPTTFSTTIYLNNNQTNPIGGAIALIGSLFSPNPLSAIYQKLIDLQNSRIPFDIVTPKRIYHSMLISSLGMTTDKNTENCLAINATFQEVIIVKVSTTQVPRIRQRNAGATGKTENAGKKSALVSLKQGLGALF